MAKSINALLYVADLANAQRKLIEQQNKEIAKDDVAKVFFDLQSEQGKFNSDAVEFVNTNIKNFIRKEFKYFEKKYKSNHYITFQRIYRAITDSNSEISSSNLLDFPHKKLLHIECRHLLIDIDRSHSELLRFFEILKKDNQVDCVRLLNLYSQIIVEYEYYCNLNGYCFKKSFYFDSLNGFYKSCKKNYSTGTNTNDQTQKAIEIENSFYYNFNNQQLNKYINPDQINEFLKIEKNLFDKNYLETTNGKWIKGKYLLVAYIHFLIKLKYTCLNIEGKSKHNITNHIFRYFQSRYSIDVSQQKKPSKFDSGSDLTKYIPEFVTIIPNISTYKR